MDPEQYIETVLEDLRKASGKLSRLEKTNTFAEDWPVLNEIKGFIEEAISELDGYNSKWREDHE